MLVRLAFAVQAFVPKEVLIVDEALAVGDMFFQAKCINRMKRLLDEGVTVLFVSHDTSTVKSLCRQAVLLDQGQMVEYDSADKVVEKYFALKVRSEQSVLVTPVTLDWPEVLVQETSSAFVNKAEFQKRASFERIQNGKAHFVNVQLLNQHGEEIVYVQYNQAVTLRMAIEICEDIPSSLGFGYHIRDQNGVDVVYSDSAIEDKTIIAPHKGERCLIEWRFKAALRAGNYSIATALGIPINLSLSQVDFCDFVPLAVQFNVAPRPESYLYGAVHWDNHVEVYRY
jgi:lipopolysaccharide transport system ATP-binding protein